METLNKHVYEKTVRPIRVVQFGEGNFLRAFIEDFVHELNHDTNFNGNIAVVQPLKAGRIKELEEQDGLYTLLIKGQIDQQRFEKSYVIDCLQSFVNPYENYEAFLHLANNPDLRFIISNTTEAGIIYDKQDISMIHVPQSFPAKLYALLKQRFLCFHGDIDKGCLILPCELIDNNGDELKAILKQFAMEKQDNEFWEWIESANYFYNTLVDRITPGFPVTQAKQLQTTLGYDDQNMVLSEPFHLWVIQGDEKLQNELPYKDTSCNILMVDDLKPYKERKVKILNGSHTWMVPIAYACGYRQVHEVMNDALLVNTLETFLTNEIIPTIQLDADSLNAFKIQVFDRFRNPYIEHQLMSISLNSMSKFKARILPALIQSFQQTNHLPKIGLFAFSSLLAMFDIKEQGIQVVKDEDFWHKLWNELEEKNTSEKVHVVLNQDFWSDLKKMKGAEALILHYYQTIQNYGMRNAILDSLGDANE